LAELRPDRFAALPAPDGVDASGARRATGVAEPMDGGRVDGSADAAGGSDEPPLAPRVLRAVGPGFDAGPVHGPEMAQLALEHLAIARTPEVVATDPWAEAGRKVLRFHLARMLARVPATMAGEDREAVHDMRVAARRVRAAWRVFGSAYERPVVRRHVAELRMLGDRLGAVRDVDVQLAILAAHRERRSKRERAALLPLVEAWTADRADRHASLIAHLSSPWFGLLVTDHEAFIAADGRDVRVTGGHDRATVRTRTPAVSWDAYEVVWGFEAALGDAEVATLHELRIATKWLRYTLEFVREPMEPAATELIRRAVVLQDHLGDIHDLNAAAALARTFAATGPDLRPASRSAIDRFAVVHDTRVDRLRRRLGPSWRGVADAEYRRSLGRALARL
jgi:CHAD domain-containing protein